MSSIATANSGGIVVKAAQCIRDNKEYLSTIDGLIGDGDHGINMEKGAGIYLTRQSEAGEGLQENLKLLSRVLMNEIGGSMGPLYGTFFGRLARTVKGKEALDLPLFSDMMAAGGALHHLGIEHFRAAGDINDKEVLDKVLQFAKCAHVVNSLKGSTYGLIGGRSLGMYSATVSMQDWQDKFGIDIEHIDQSEIVRLADTIPQEQVDKAFGWLTENVGRIEYDDKKLTPEKLKQQIRHYEATKKIIEDRRLDFIGVKCHYEMSRHYCTQCLSAAFCNDPYDWDGPKEPVVCACEADSDAALTMQILHLLTNDPVVFMDVRHYDKDYDVMVFCNCGSQSTYYAAASDDPRENLKKVTLYPCLDIYAGGGCHVNLMTKPGKATIARLNRTEGKYRMTIIPTEFVELPEEKMAETTKEWPHVFAKLPFDHQIFLDRFDANHCHAVYGDHVESLKMICQMLDIDVEILGE